MARDREIVRYNPRLIINEVAEAKEIFNRKITGKRGSKWFLNVAAQ